MKDRTGMRTVCIQNGEVVLPDRTIPGGTVILVRGRIRYAGPPQKTPPGATEIQAPGAYVTPGLIDVHIHGAGLVGWESCTAEGLKHFDQTLLAQGILRFVPTMMADERVIRRMADLLAAAECADRVPGLYVEGPFISLEKRGGVQEPYIRPVSLAYLKRLQRIASGRIRMMTFAPELKHAQRLPAAMRSLGILPCVGHSQATAAQTAAFSGRQTVSCTHLFNAMSGLDHRTPGVAAWALNDDRAYAELNSDGTHVAPDLVRIAYRVKHGDRLVLISDAVAPAGAEPGSYDYMDLKVKSTPRGVYYAESGTLIGSSVLLNTHVQRFIQYSGAAVYDAIRMASLNPARLLGIGRRAGSLEPGKSADVVVFARDFSRTLAVFVKGRQVNS